MELLVKLAGNPILEACPELIPCTLSFVFSTYFNMLCYPFVLGNFGHYVQDILALPLVTEGQETKTTVNDMLKARSNDQHFLGRCEISLDPENKLDVILYIYIYIYIYMVCRLLHPPSPRMGGTPWPPRQSDIRLRR